jgi:hypothetical protein
MKFPAASGWGLFINEVGGVISILILRISPEAERLLDAFTTTIPLSFTRV